MKKLLVLVLCVGLVGISICFAQEAEQPLQLTIAADKQVYGLGDTITLNCTVVNNSAEIIQFYPLGEKFVKLQGVGDASCSFETIQTLDLSPEPLVALKPGEAHYYSLKGRLLKRKGALSEEVFGSKEKTSPKGTNYYSVYGIFIDFESPSFNHYYLSDYGTYEIRLIFRGANNPPWEEYKNYPTYKEREALLKDKWKGKLTSNTITIEVVEKTQNAEK